MMLQTLSEWRRAYVVNQLRFTDTLSCQCFLKASTSMSWPTGRWPPPSPHKCGKRTFAMAKRIRKIGEDTLGVPNADVECAHPALKFARIARHFGVVGEEAI